MDSVLSKITTSDILQFAKAFSPMDFTLLERFSVVMPQLKNALSPMTVLPGAALPSSLLSWKVTVVNFAQDANACSSIDLMEPGMSTLVIPDMAKAFFPICVTGLPS